MTFDDSQSSISVFIVARQMIQAALGGLVGSADGLHVSGTGTSLEHAVAAARHSPVDVVLVDVDHDEEALRRNLSILRVLPTIALTSHDTSALDWAFSCGLRGVLSTNIQPGCLVKAIRKVQEGEIWIDRRAVARILLARAGLGTSTVSDTERARIALLTRREMEAIAALASNAAVPCKVIADRLHISENTLRNHLTSIYGKLRVHSRVDLFAFAARTGLQGAVPQPPEPAWTVADFGPAPKARHNGAGTHVGRLC